MCCKSKQTIMNVECSCEEPEAWEWHLASLPAVHLCGLGLVFIKNNPHYTSTPPPSPKLLLP